METQYTERFHRNIDNTPPVDPEHKEELEMCCGNELNDVEAMMALPKWSGYTRSDRIQLVIATSLREVLAVLYEIKDEGVGVYPQGEK